MKKPVHRTLFSILISATVLFCINLSLILFPVLYGADFYSDISQAPDATYVILLGGGISDEGMLGKPVLNRLQVAGVYLKTHDNALCVVTGGTLKHRKYAEAPAMKEALMTMGISENRILLEDKALDTIQNLQNSVQLIADQMGIEMSQVLEEPITIVTNRFHTGRSLFLAKRLGFRSVTGLAAQTPSEYVLYDYLRETAAWLKLELRILFTGEPSVISVQLHQ